MSGCSATQFGGVPYVGALFDSSNGQPTTHFATAFVVAGKYGNMLMSAAHILNGRSASSIIFAPGYADGQAPHNLWHVHKAYTEGYSGDRNVMRSLSCPAAWHHKKMARSRKD